MESVTSDGGVRKRVLRAGEGGAVGPGARVTVKYELCLAGSAGVPFDASATRPDGRLTFRLGRRKALLGVEALAASMEVGEHCSGSIQPAYAYGSAGLPRCKVPPDAVIEVDIEMLAAEPKEKAKGLIEMSPAERFEEAGRCKERGNAFFKEAKVEKAAAEYQRCLRFIEYVFYRRSKQTSEANDVSEKRETEEISEGAEASKEDETSSGTQPTESSGNVEEAEEEIEVVDATKESSVTGEPKIATSAVTATEPVAGEAGFVEASTTNGDTDRNDADGSEKEEPQAEECLGKDDPTTSQVRELHVVTLNNLALCLLKLGENKRAEELCSLSMALDGTNHKPLFYRGRARVAMGSWEEAKADFQAAAKLAPKNMGIRGELEKLKKKLNAHKVRERKAAAAMFG